jgi:hypothetical protein
MGEKEELVFTNNNLFDIINWLKKGYMVCLYSYNKKIFFYNKEILENITNEKLIYVNVSHYASLLSEGEWPWYIMKEGFIEYKNNHILPTNEENIYQLSLSY